MSPAIYFYICLIDEGPLTESPHCIRPWVQSLLVSMAEGRKKQGSWRRVLDDVLFKQFNSVSPRDLQKFQEIRQAVERQHSNTLTTKASKRHYQFNSEPGVSGQSRKGRVE